MTLDQNHLDKIKELENELIYQKKLNQELREKLHQNDKQNWEELSFEENEDTLSKYNVPENPEELEKKHLELQVLYTSAQKIQKELALSKEMAESANKAKSEFLANMSHEIRTPMNAILGMTHLIMRTELTTKQSNYIHKINSSAQALLGIINEILDFSKIEAGKLELEKISFDIESVFQSVADVISVKAEEHNNQFKSFIAPETPKKLLGDPLRVSQILINLANNAAKFTENGTVSISVYPETADNICHLKFVVEDTGIGMSESQTQMLFESFTQADTSTTRKYGGTGLGLAICKKLSELMQGSITVSSELGVGSTFTFYVSLEIDQAYTQQESIESNPLFHHKTALVADDTKVSRTILTSMLKSFGMNVVIAEDGQEAVNQVTLAAEKNTPFDLVIMDWQMPGLNGIEAASIIKKDLQLDVMPAIIMTTAYSREEFNNESSALGIDGLLLKPIVKSVLLETLQDILGPVAPIGAEKETINHEDPSSLPDYFYKKRILLVEDNHINQEVAGEILRDLGFIVELADDGNKAVKRIFSEDFDLVLMDIQMPYMDGLTATGLIRAESRFSDLPIIALSAHAMQSDKEKSIKAGMNDHITKPIEIPELVQALTQWLPKFITDLAPEPTQNDKPDRRKKRNEEAPLPDKLGPYNLKAALARCGGRPDLLKSMLSSFYVSYNTVDQTLQELIEAQDYEAAQRLAHTFKGISGSLEATQLANASKNIETSLRDMQLDKLPEQLKLFKLYLTPAIEAASTFVSFEEPLIDRSHIKVDLEALKDKLNALDKDIDSSRWSAYSLFEELEEELLALDLKEQVKELKGSLENLNFPVAKEALQKLYQNINFS